MFSRSTSNQSMEYPGKCENSESFSSITSVLRSPVRRLSSFHCAKPKISSWDAGWNVTNSIQGMFVLGLPFAIMHGGYLGLFLIVLTAVVSCYTGKILVECLYETDINGAKHRVRESYGDVATACWGKSVGGTIVNVSQLIELLMTCVLYIIVSGNLMANSFPDSGIGEGGWSTLAALILTPCIFLKDLRAVSKLSMGCTIAQILVVAITLFYCLTRIQDWAWSQLSLGIDRKNFPVSIGVIVFSYTSQIFLPSLEGSMERPQNFNKMLDWSYGASCGAKFFFALMCFLTWSHETKEVVTDNLPNGLRVVVSFVLVAKALLSYPLPYYASVEALERTLFNGGRGLWHLFGRESHPYEDFSSSYFEESSADTPTQNSNQVPTKTETTMLKSSTMIVMEDSEARSVGCFPHCYKPNGDTELWAYGLRFLLVLGTFLVALFIPHFSLLMGLTGSLTGASLSFVFPSAFYLQLQWRMLSRRDIAVNISIVIVGILCGASGIYRSIQGLYNAYHPLPIEFPWPISNSSFFDNFNTTAGYFGATSEAPIPGDLIIFKDPDYR